MPPPPPPTLIIPNDNEVDNAENADDSSMLPFDVDSDSVIPIPILTPGLQFQHHIPQQQVQRSVVYQPSFISFPHGTILCVLNQKRGSMLLDPSWE